MNWLMDFLGLEMFLQMAYEFMGSSQENNIVRCDSVWQHLVAANDFKHLQCCVKSNSCVPVFNSILEARNHFESTLMPTV